MEGVRLFLEGKKTYLLVIAYVLIVMLTGAEGVGDTLDLSNIDAETVKEALLGLMVATAKSAWDRFATKDEPAPPVVEG